MLSRGAHPQQGNAAAASLWSGDPDASSPQTRREMGLDVDSSSSTEGRSRRRRAGGGLALGGGRRTRLVPGDVLPPPPLRRSIGAAVRGAAAGVGTPLAPGVVQPPPPLKRGREAAGRGAAAGVGTPLAPEALQPSLLDVESSDSSQARKARNRDQKQKARGRESTTAALKRKASDAAAHRDGRRKETAKEKAERNAQDATAHREAYGKQTPAAKARHASREKKRRATQTQKRVAHRTEQLQHLMRTADGSEADGEEEPDASSSSGSSSGDQAAAPRRHIRGQRCGGGPTAARAARPAVAGSSGNFPSRRPWLLMDALKAHLSYEYRRQDNPLRPKMGPFIKSEATKDWPQRQQDLAPGEPLKEIPFSVHVDTAVKLAHAANHYMPDSVCACCSEMKAPAEYMLMLWHLIPHSELLRGDVARTNAVIRPCRKVHYRSEPREGHQPPPDPVLPVGFTRYVNDAWVKQGHKLPFDQEDAPRPPAEAARQQEQGHQPQQQQQGRDQQAEGAGGGAGVAAAVADVGPAVAPPPAATPVAEEQHGVEVSSDDGECFMEA